ncbi:hypothetical protein QE368_001089 [Asaia bogorensis NBRC 16594]|nr:hypothetical protein [Asaia bogorensis NBRC 16594]
MKQPGFFDKDERLARLSGLGDQLEVFSRTVDFEASALIWRRLWLTQTGARAGVRRSIRY